VQLGTVDVNKLKGIGDKAVGLSKELIGALTGNDQLQEAGEAQQEKATETLRALRSEAKAQAKEAKADVLEQRQRAAQAAKR
jgi:uncharacterized protein YjbJ (UPF0337 family)